MAGTLPPLFEITDSDEGGYAAVAVYTLLALTLVIVVARLSTRWYIGGVLHSDDILLAVSTVCDGLACYIPVKPGSNPSDFWLFSYSEYCKVYWSNSPSRMDLGES